MQQINGETYLNIGKVQTAIKIEVTIKEMAQYQMDGYWVNKIPLRILNQLKCSIVIPCSEVEKG